MNWVVVKIQFPLDLIPFLKSCFYVGNDQIVELYSYGVQQILHIHEIFLLIYHRLQAAIFRITQLIYFDTQ